MEALKRMPQQHVPIGTGADSAESYSQVMLVMNKWMNIFSFTLLLHSVGPQHTLHSAQYYRVKPSISHTNTVSDT